MNRFKISLACQSTLKYFYFIFISTILLAPFFVHAAFTTNGSITNKAEADTRERVPTLAVEDKVERKMHKAIVAHDIFRNTLSASPHDFSSSGTYF